MSRHAEERLGPYLEGELRPDERRAVEIHLESCEACSRALQELRATVALLRLVPEPRVPDRLGRTVMDRIAAGEPRWHVRLVSWLRSVRRGPLPSALGAAVAAAVVVVVVRNVDPPGAPRVTSLQLAPSAPESARVDASGRAGGRDAPPGSAALRAGSLRPAASPSGSLPPAFPHRAERRGGVGAGAAAPELLPPRPALPGCQAFAGGSLEGSSLESACRPWLSGMLTLAQYDLPAFIAELNVLPGPERDAWLSELVRFAVRSGSAARVAGDLRASVDARAATLAERFERGIHSASASE